MLDKVKNIFLILSGKGGVGKSTVSVQLSLALQESGKKVGLLDLDLCGPSIPYLLGLENENIYQHDSGWLPIYLNDGDDSSSENSNKMAIMSIGFLLKNRNEAVVWRGPKKTSMIKQFLNDVHWGELDYLIIDTPPGTSDEHITVMECLRGVCNGAILVTTPQLIALDDVRKEITFCKKTGINIIGLIENMNGYICPHCENCTNIFSSGGGEELAKLAKIELLGSLPIEPKIGEANVKNSIIKLFPNSKSCIVLKSIVHRIIENSEL